MEVEKINEGWRTPPDEGSGGEGNTSPPNFYKISEPTLSTLSNSYTTESEPKEGEVVEVVGGFRKGKRFIPRHSGDYPKDYEQNVEFRQTLIGRAQRNTDVRELVYLECRDNILFWVNCFATTYNPRKTPSTLPFITYEYEDKLILELVECVKNQKDILIDKSRDMGVTWCVLLVYVWFWQFHGEGQDFLVGSRKEQYIDVMGNMDTLLEKVRFIIKNQPAWMRPKGFNFKNHSNYLKIVNPDTKSTITGEATNNNFSRGGRRRSIFLDEFAFWECDQAAWRASADSSNCRIVVSTPFGFNNQFAKLRWSGAINVKSLHWKLHPEKDQAWYDNECKRRNNDAVEIAQELDINYEGSDEGILFNFNDMKKAAKNEPLMSRERKVVSLDPAGEGDDEAVFYVSNNGNIVERKFIAKSNAMELGAEALNLISKHKAQVFICDAIGNDIISIVTNLLGKNPENVKVIAFKSSEKARDTIKYYNRRAEAYHEAATQMKSGNVQVDDDYTLMKQLNATKYSSKNGRILISPKEEIKEKVGSSPDRADAWVLAVEGLRYTYSKDEVRAAAPFRKNFSLVEEVTSDKTYGDWGDEI